MVVRPTTIKLMIALTALTCAPWGSTVEPLDDESMAAFRLQGLDPPAAGEVRTAVASDVSVQTQEKVTQDLLDNDSDDALGATVQQEAVVRSDVVATNQNFVSSDRKSEVAIVQDASANQSSSQKLEQGGTRMSVRNEASYIQVRNIRDEPGIRLDPGTFQIETIRVNTDITVRGR